MIKRRFYKQDHGDKSDTSDSSSSDESDSAPELEVMEDHQVEEEEEEEGGMWNYEKSLVYQSPELEAVEDHQVEEVEEEEVEVMWNYEKPLFCPSPGSGYESEDSSNNQGETDASGLLINEEEWTDEGLGNNKDRKATNKVPIHKNKRPPKSTEIIIDPNDSIQAEISNFILKCKSTFKCRLCPRVLCLNEATLMTHLASKRHGRSKKLFGEGRLKVMLNSDEELEEQEIHAEIPVVSKKKNSGRQRQSHRRKKRMRSGSMKGNSKASVENAVKKRCRTD